MDVGAWLRDLGLGRYEPAFRGNEIDAEVLPKLTAEDLTALGVTAVGHRRKLLAAIAALRDGASPAGDRLAEAESEPTAPSTAAPPRPRRPRGSVPAPRPSARQRGSLVVPR